MMAHSGTLERGFFDTEGTSCGLGGESASAPLAPLLWLTALLAAAILLDAGAITRARLGVPAVTLVATGTNSNGCLRLLPDERGGLAATGRAAATGVPATPSAATNGVSPVDAAAATAAAMDARV